MNDRLERTAFDWLLIASSHCRFRLDDEAQLTAEDRLHLDSALGPNLIESVMARANRSVVVELEVEPSGSSRKELCVSPYFRWKHVLDWSLAVVLLIPALPLMALLILLVRLTSRGPGVFRQVRVGLNGRIYTMYKIRTMCLCAEARSGAVWTQSMDPRVTRLGRFLRASHLDVLPQLFNVIRGEMSLVGPRPERPEFVSVLAEEIADYRDRLLVRPGMTGLAQVNLPPDTDLDSVQRKVMLDREYVRSAGCFFDLRIVLATALTLFGVGHWANRVLKVAREVELDVAVSDHGSEFASDEIASYELMVPRNSLDLCHLEMAFDILFPQNSCAV